VIIFKILFIFLISYVSIHANEKEDLLRGVILERISQFVTYEDVGDNFLICIYKDKEMTNIFDNLYKDRKHKGDNISIKNISSIKKINGCDILYVQNVTSSIKKNLFSKHQDYTLLVTNEVEYLADGFMLALYLQKSKIRFAINHKALLDANLKINYRLLKVASKVINPVKNY